MMNRTSIKTIAALASIALIINALNFTLIISVVSQEPDAISDRMQRINPQQPPPFEIDQDRVLATGIRITNSTHLELYTDARGRDDVDQLPQIFDLAIAQWCEYFSIPQQRTESWKIRAFVMEDEARFQKAGLIPPDLPRFPAGFQHGRNMWVYVQPGPYYTRHLLLHEGTHAFMAWFLNGQGCPWFAEGMAEKLALHQLDAADGKPPFQLTLNLSPNDRNLVPYWGRVTLVQKDLAQNQGLSLKEAMFLPNHSFRDVRYYGWAWALCEFLSNHELSKAPFAKLHQQCNQPISRFERSIYEALTPHWETLDRDWQLYVHELDYGTDVPRTCLSSTTTIRKDAAAETILLRTDHGWQATEIKVEQGDRIQILCSSRYTVGQSIEGDRTIPWISTANGITLDYHQGKPLGVLLIGTVQVDSEDSAAAIAGLLDPVSAGESADMTIKTSGTLCLRINESTARISDNEGVLEVTIKKVQ